MKVPFIDRGQVERRELAYWKSFLKYIRTKKVLLLGNGPVTDTPEHSALLRCTPRGWRNLPELKPDIVFYNGKSPAKRHLGAKYIFFNRGDHLSALPKWFAEIRHSQPGSIVISYSSQDNSSLETARPYLMPHERWCAPLRNPSLGRPLTGLCALLLLLQGQETKIVIRGFDFYGNALEKHNNPHKAAAHKDMFRALIERHGERIEIDYLLSRALYGEVC